MYSVQINTRKMIRQDELRSDCRDLRVTSERKVVGSRVQANTCNTSNTWVFFSNARGQNGLVMNPNDKVGNISILHRNKNPGLRRRHASEYSASAISLLKPESAVEMYYGSHDTVTVDHNTHLHANDKDAPEQVWHAQFDNTGNSCCNSFNNPPDRIIIQDEQGNQVTRSSGIDSNGVYTITSSNVPSFVERGEDITVQFEFDARGGSTTGTSTPRTAQWGYALDFADPAPRSTEIATSSPELNVTIQDEENTGVTVTFFGNGSQVGTDSIGSTPGTVETEWTGLTSDALYEWRVEATDGSRTVTSSTYQFTVDTPAEIIDIYFSNASATHSFEAGALIQEKRSSLSNCDAEASALTEIENYGPDITSKNSTHTWCNVSIGYDDRASWENEHDDSDSLSLLTPDVTFEAEDNIGGRDSATSSNTFPNNQPSIDDTSFNYPEIPRLYGFNTTVNISDSDNGADEISSCSLMFSDGDDSITVNGEIRDRTGSNAECHYNNTNTTLPSSFDVREQIDVEVTVTDIHGSTSSTVQDTNTIPNTPPVVESFRPENNSLLADSPVEISVQGRDPEGDEVALYFFNKTDGTDLLDKVRNSNQGSYEWGGLPIREPAYWSFSISDPYTNTSSGNLSFEKITSSDFRISIDVPQRNEVVSVINGSTRSISFTVQNPSSRTKRLNLSLRSVNASFTGFGFSRDVSVSPRSQKTFRAQVQPQSPGQKKLTVKAQNRQVDLVTNETIDVVSEGTVRSGGDDGLERDVPGLSATAVAAVLVSSLVVFWFL